MIWLYSASALSAITLLVHLFAGGVSAAKPLLASDLDPEAKYTNYYCWHLVAIVLATMALCFFVPTVRSSSIDLAALASAMAAAFAVWSFLLIGIKKQPLFSLPQWALFLPISILGLIGYRAALGGVA